MSFNLINPDYYLEETDKTKINEETSFRECLPEYLNWSRKE